MIASWQKLARDGTGPQLVHQIASACYTEGQWPFVALAHRSGTRVKLLVSCKLGVPQPSMEYALSDAPCRTLYQQSSRGPLLVNGLEAYHHWPLSQNYRHGCYVAIRLPMHDEIGDFHLLLLSPVAGHSDQLPQSLLKTAAYRLAADLAQQKTRFEMMALKQLQACSSVASALVNDQLRLRHTSQAMANLFDSSPEQLDGQLLTECVDWASPLPVPIEGQGSTSQCCFQTAQGETVDVTLTLAPLAHGFRLELLPINQPSHRRSDQPQSELALQQRVQDELHRIKRNGHVAALLFVQFAPSCGQAEALVAELRRYFRGEDQFGVLDSGSLALLTACFDHQGQAPRHQMTTIVDKVSRCAHNWQRRTRDTSALTIRARTITGWDMDPIELLREENAPVCGQPQRTPSLLREYGKQAGIFNG